jgi:hypothetical protein
MFARYRGMRRVDIIPPAIPSQESDPALPSVDEDTHAVSQVLPVPDAFPRSRRYIHPAVAFFPAPDDAVVPSGEAPLPMDELSRAIFEMDIDYLPPSNNP